MELVQLEIIGRFVTFFMVCFGPSFVKSSRDLALNKTATQSSTYGSYEAGRAVDGVLGRHIADGHCSHTGIGHHYAWWKVDLGDIYRIQMINITYRNGRTDRLNGYSLYVTNNSYMTLANGHISEHPGHLCYHDNEAEVPTYNQSRQCHTTGRYVVFYNTRSNADTYIELCGVQVYGCPPGKFGFNCSETCHCTTDGCNPDTGQCDVQGCQTGWMGLSCSLQCHCKSGGECNIDTGACVGGGGCETGWSGPSCFVGPRDLSFNKTTRQSSTNSQFGSERAVDGVISADVTGVGSCSHTSPVGSHTEAWWEVDLGQVQRIQTINIVYRQLYANRMSGFYLYVSNNSYTTFRSLSGDYLCYHDLGPGLPSYIQSLPCHVNGRYVTFFNKRPADYEPRNVMYYSETNAVVELCEVQVLGACSPGFKGESCNEACDHGSFGQDCNQTCHCATSDCNKQTGICEHLDCKAGWKGNTCSQACGPGRFGQNCIQQCRHCSQQTCDRQSGRCTGGCLAGWKGDSCSHACDNGTYGQNCVQRCHCYEQDCNKQTGSCARGCLPGWQGVSCNQVCSNGTFGQDCSENCHCAASDCNKETGRCGPAGCSAGWKGLACSQACSYGTFGQHCSQSCHCATSDCNKTTGICDSPGCSPGWKGLTCSQECVNNTFGRDCRKTCHCAISGCNRTDGVCFKPGCKEGWMGNTCSQECVNKTFGRDCNKTCHCVNAGCNRTDGVCFLPGCTEGWMGHTCTRECVNNTFGRDCSKTCHCINSGCNRANGVCDIPGCTEGWRGNTCTQECVNNTFGRDCSKTCYCAIGGCNRTDGVCDVPGCTDGWMGNTCSQECDNKTFGRDCNKTCHCVNSGCNRTDGVCFLPGCTEGWMGNTCTKECENKTFGRDCKKTCHCANSGCNRTDGVCVVPGCEKGWSEDSCSHECTSGNFGANCSEECHCQQQGCDRINGSCDQNGCQIGWSGEACNQPLRETSQESPPGSSGLIGGSVAAVVAVLVVIVIAVGVVRKRRIPSKDSPVGSNFNSSNKKSGGNGENVYVNIGTNGISMKRKELKTPTVIETDIDEDEVVYVNGPSDEDVRGETKLLVSDLKEIVKTKHENDMYEVEFKSLPHGLKHPHSNATLEQNIPRNRFKTTFPYDHSRVVLKKERKGSTDYINANFIDGVHSQKTYIATQGPKTLTLEEFWRMAWQNNCGKIIMLANLVEVGKVKCATYWTGKDGNPLELGLFQVTLQEEMAYAFYTIRKLVVKNKQTNTSRQISQYHFTRWPDHGVPEPFELLQFYKRVRSDRTNYKGPLIVHCSAGIGRTGSFIGLDALMLEGNTNDEIDVFAYTEKMRKDRMNMIQTADQYAMLHDVLLEGLTVVTSSMSKTDFSKVVNDMLDGDIPSQQYSVLKSERPAYSTIEYKTALQNKQKNRNKSVLAVEKYKVRLMTTSEYINAVNIPGYRNPYGYILTQHPLDNTVIDFLSLVAQERSDTVVSIGRLQNNPRWPTEQGSVSKFGNFVVTNVRCGNISFGSKNVEERHLTIVNKEIGADTKITLFEAPSWGNSLPDISFMLELTHVIQCKQDIDAPPVMITCSDGATECGLLCVLCNVMERLEVDGDVDIMAAVRQLQIRRPQCFPNKDQYVFCYTSVREHIEASTVYANV